MAYVFNNRTFLNGIPEAPPFLFNISHLRGAYVIGDNVFKASREVIAPPFQSALRLHFLKNRNVEFISGTLAVLLIGLVSELIQSILLHSHRRKITSGGLHAAYVLDEISHFRSLWRYATSPVDPQKSIYSKIFGRRKAHISLLIVTIPVIVFIVDVIAVYVTQPTDFFSPSSQHNLRGMQPVGTRLGRARRIRQNTAERPCISPLHFRELRQRFFKIFSCTTYDTNRALFKDVDLSETITIGSWYHYGGNDHNISFGDGWHSVSVRPSILVNNGEEVRMKRILFNSTEDVMNNTKYLHDVTIYATMEWACNKNFSRAGCSQLVSELRPISSVVQHRQILLWTRDGQEVTTNATGLVSSYEIRLNAPYRAVSDGMRVLVASSAVLEVRDTGWYEDELDGTQQLVIPRLLSETGRVAGIYMLLLILLSLIFLLAVIRCLLNPVSLAFLALAQVRRKKKLRRRAESTFEEETFFRSLSEETY